MSDNSLRDQKHRVKRLLCISWTDDVRESHALLSCVMTCSSCKGFSVQQMVASVRLIGSRLILVSGVLIHVPLK